MLTVTVSSPAHYATLLSAFAAACGTGGAYCAEVLEVLAAEGPISLWASATALARRANDAADERASQNFTIDEGEIRYSTREHEITLSCSEGSTDWVLVIDHERNDDSDRMQVAVAVLEAGGLADHVEAWRLAPVEVEIEGLTEAQLCGALAAYIGAVSSLGSGVPTVLAKHHDDFHSLAIDLAWASVPGLRLEFDSDGDLAVALSRGDGSIATQYDGQSLRLVIQPGQWDAPAVACSRLETDGVGRDRLIAACAKACAADDRCVSRPLTQRQIAALLGAEETTTRDDDA